MLIVDVVMVVKGGPEVGERIRSKKGSREPTGLGRFRVLSRKPPKRLKVVHLLL